MTLTAMRPEAGRSKGREVSLCRPKISDKDGGSYAGVKKVGTLRSLARSSVSRAWIGHHPSGAKAGAWEMSMFMRLFDGENDHLWRFRGILLPATWNAEQPTLS